MQTYPQEPQNARQNHLASPLSDQVRQYSLTLADVAAMCGVTAGTIRHWAKSRPGFPKPLKISRNVWRFAPEQIESWIAQRLAEAGGENIVEGQGDA